MSRIGVFPDKGRCAGEIEGDAAGEIAAAINAVGTLGEIGQEVGNGSQLPVTRELRSQGDS